MNVLLQEASPTPPAGLEEFLLKLGTGENGFGGTPFAAGRITLTAYLQNLVDRSNPSRPLPPDRVPQTIFWILGETGKTIGMLRMRHYLNDNLLHHGGHIGYYIHPAERGKGCGKQALGRALRELARLGEKRALLTTDADNHPSISVIEANGGILEDQRIDESSGVLFNRYWIDLKA